MKTTATFHNNYLQNILSSCFGDIFQEDIFLEKNIEVYKKSTEIKKNILRDQILTWFLQNSPKNLNIDTFMEQYSIFIDKIDNLNFPTELKNILESLDIKLFRQKENNKKANFILDNSDITLKILSLSKKLSNKNPYHNFGHQLGVAETAIKLAQHQKLSKKDINLLVFASLFHDARYSKTGKMYAEENSYQIAIDEITNEIFSQLDIKKNDFYRLIISTKLDLHGKINDPLVKIIQDADIAILGKGPYYLLYSAMGLLEENNITIEQFLDFEYNFLNTFPNQEYFFNSLGGRDLLLDPRSTLDIISSWPKKTLIKSYELRNVDITFQEFIDIINEILNG